MRFICLAFMVPLLIFGCADETQRLTEAIDTIKKGIDEVLDWKKHTYPMLTEAEAKFNEIDHDLAELYKGAIYAIYRSSKQQAFWTEKSVLHLDALIASTTDVRIKTLAEKLKVLATDLDKAYMQNIINQNGVIQEIKDLLGGN